MNLTKIMLISCLLSMIGAKTTNVLNRYDEIISKEFTLIDDKGNVVDVVARAPDSKLEREAQRVINKLPRMTPGRQGDMPVEVIYTIPIKFNID